MVHEHVLGSPGQERRGKKSKENYFGSFSKRGRIHGLGKGRMAKNIVKTLKKKKEEKITPQKACTYFHHPSPCAPSVLFVTASQPFSIHHACKTCLLL